ncbi:MAG: hypothetical protein GY832_25150 [Chloroflexi bacterium]|nr:hypothetical protein [Chloroflexota bacterium]
MDERKDYVSRRERLMVFVGVAGVAFAITLAVMIGNRLSDEALAVLTGAVCGVGAAIPTSLLIVAVTRRRDVGRGTPQPTVQPQNAYPPVVVIAPPGGQRWMEGGGMPTFEVPTQRRFTVVGGEQGQGNGIEWGER